jgi:hypothetical protein
MRDYNYRREEEWIDKRQEQWASSTKGAVSKLFFPNIKERMKNRIPISSEFTAMVTDHGFNQIIPP